jgi:nucleotide-binding universal stress UspA family protein
MLVTQMMKEHMKILVGLDGSEHSKKALKEAVQIAKKFTGSITIVSVYTKENEDENEKMGNYIESSLKEEGIQYGFKPILGSNPSKAILETAAEEKAELVVVGSRGLGKAAAFILGSVSKEVVSSSSCNVLVVK